MKRILSLFIAFVLILSTFASCSLITPKVEEADISEAVKELQDMYKKTQNTAVADGKELAAQIKIGQTVFNIEWTSNNDSISVENVDGMAVVRINSDDITETTNYTLTANITSEGGQTATFELNLVVTVSFGMITAPEAGVAYKLALKHGGEDGDPVVYFDGNNYNNYAWYFSYTTDILSAVDVYLETVEGVEGGYRLYFDKDGVKTYVVAFPRDGDTTKGTLKFDTVVPSEYWTYSTEYNTLVYTSVTGEQFYMGSSGTYKSISCSAISYVTGATNYPCRLYGVGGVEETLPEQELPTVPENYTSKDIVEALYKLESGQTLEGPYEFTGVITSFKYAYDPAYNNVSVNIVVDGMTDKPVLCYRLNGGEELEVGDTITVFAGITNYNGTYETTSGGVIRNVVKGEGTPDDGGETPDGSDAESILNALYALADGETLTGSYTLTGKITALDNYNNPTIVVEGFEDKPVYCYKLVVSKAVGDTITVTATTMKNYGGTYEFMNCTLVEEGGEEGGDDPVVTPTYTAPVAGQPYYLFLEQTTLGKTLYFNGTINADGRMLTTDDVNTAVAIYFEEVTGGYHIYFMNGDVKTYIADAPYINADGYIKCRLAGVTEAPTTVWTYDTTLGIIEMAVTYEGKSDTFFAGTYGSYDTISLSGAYYKNQIASGTQYPARIVLVEGGEVTPPEGGEEGGEVTPPEGGEEGGDDTTGDDGVWTIPEVLASASGTSVVISGTVSEIYQSWSDQYSNISFYIKDDAGNKLLVYRTGTNVVVGDQVTVTGTTTLYNNVIQIAQGGVTVIDVKHVCSDFTEVTCQNLATCKVCGTTTGELADHNIVDGVCSVCGKSPDVTYITATKTMAELISALGWTSSTTKQTFSLDDNVTVAVNGGSNTGKAYNGDHIRIYATDTPAGTLTISVPEGYELVSVKVTTTTGTYAFLCVDGSSTDISNTTTSVSGNSVVLNSVKNGEDGKQVRVMAIEVVYYAK